MADNKLVFETEVKGVEQSISSIKDLKNAIKDAKDEQVKMASAFGQGSKEYQDATKKLSELKDKVEDLNDSTKSLKGTGVEQLTQGFSQMKEGLMNLDFDKVKGGIAAMQSGMGAFATAAKGALQGVKGALIATGIGALVVLLGTIVAYWDDIKGAINGVTKEQEKLNELTKDNYNTEKAKLDALNSQDNTLRLQGKSEKEILQIKIKQLDATYAAAEAQLNSTIRTQQAQEKASQRNKEILSGMLDFVNIPLTLLLKGVDLVGKALGQNFGLAEGFKKSVSDLVLGDDKELADKNKKELDAQVKTLSELKNQRAGYTLAINKIDDDSNKVNLDNYKKYLEDKQKAEDDAWQLTLRIREQNAAAEDENNKRLAEQKKADEAADRQSQLDAIAESNSQEQILQMSNSDFNKELRRTEFEELKGNYNTQLQVAQQTTNSLQSLSDAYFYFKTKNLQKGSEAELKAAHQQFKINKALSITSAIISGIQGVVNALSAQSVIPEPFGSILKGVTAAGVGIAAAVNVAKISAMQFNPGSTPSGGGAQTSIPVPAAPTINTPQANTNSSTTFDETGKKIGGENNTTPTIKVNATVGVNEIAEKSNRVNVLESQSKF